MADGIRVGGLKEARTKSQVSWSVTLPPKNVSLQGGESHDFSSSQSHTITPTLADCLPTYPQG